MKGIKGRYIECLKMMNILYSRLNIFVTKILVQLGGNPPAISDTHISLLKDNRLRYHVTKVDRPNGSNEPFSTVNFVPYLTSIITTDLYAQLCRNTLIHLSFQNRHTIAWVTLNKWIISSFSKLTVRLTSWTLKSASNFCPSLVSLTYSVTMGTFAWPL